jgi:glycosyltransferase involved in cell wall biosynthesis
MSKPLFDICLITKNEAKVLPRLLKSLEEFKNRGGGVNIVDTGSTDNTVKIAREWGCNVKEVGEIYLHTVSTEKAKQINNRFIVANEQPIIQGGEKYFDFAAARNESCKIAKKDWVSFVDADEVFTKLDIDKINKIISNSAIAHLEYNFVFSHFPDGSELIKFMQSKFYDRRKMEWIGVIHEILTPKVTDTKAQFVGEDIFKLEHWQNPESNRTGYLRGLAVDCFDHQKKDRNSHYAGREFWWTGRPYTAAKEFIRHIKMDCWPAERAESMLFLSDIAGAMAGMKREELNKKI